MKPIRVLIAKPGLDGHDRGALIIAQALRDHGMEVIYTGLRQSAVQIARAAVQEDVDVVGLSSLSGAHKSLFPKVVEALKKEGADDIPVIGGGVIPAEDIPYLEGKGVHKIFTSGSPTDAIAVYIKQLIHQETISTPKKIAHIGIAVESIDAALPFYQHTLGMELEAVEDVESEHVRAAFLRIGETKLELLEPLNETSAIASFLEKRGSGIHHIALEVDDLHKRLQQYKEQGIRMIHDEPKTGAHQADIAFMHPKASGGVLYELWQPGKGE
ncbi:methylmalonyl-CoA epimerase [Halobacillus kuroshimensis]|uniref:Methylmalonyl-CoA epimerase n=1 Tax=Halobacillus kuroshimensis TaxID=302481 RepID=A0ABS3DYX8_9BACI|nr:methylmalonyl-CoA epimerase [Halobacillus kuroshimensis]MBN8236555.1 methylmalonyl-CoA epimerase [Halobacillus kuroshimensis]